VIEFRLSVDALGQTRFAYSPLAEVASSFWALESHHMGPLLQPWLRRTREALQALDLDLLRAAAPQGHFAADFLFLWSTDPKTSVEQQLERLIDLPDDILQRDVDSVWKGRRMPPQALRLRNGGQPVRRQLAETILAYWNVAIAPHWSRIRAVIDDDVSYRAAQVLGGGLYDLVSDLHPEVTLRAGVLQVDKPHLPDATYTEAELTLLPSVFVCPKLIIGHETPGISR